MKRRSDVFLTFKSKAGTANLKMPTAAKRGESRVQAETKCSHRRELPIPCSKWSAEEIQNYTDTDIDNVVNLMNIDKDHDHYCTI